MKKILVIVASLAFTQGSMAQTLKNPTATKNPAASAKRPTTKKVVPGAKKATVKKAPTKKNAPNAKKAVTQKPPKVKRKALTADDRLQDFKRRYRSGEINHRILWEELDRLGQPNSGLTEEGRQSLLQLQATMLAEGKYPILGSLYASEAVVSAKNPLSKDLTQAWSILSRTAEKRSIQLILEDLVAQTKIEGAAPPVFENNWYYHVGNALVFSGRNQEALQAFKKLRMKDRYFLPAKYQAAMVYNSLGDRKSAYTALQTILNAEPQRQANMTKTELKGINNYAKLGLARLFYEDKQFKNSIKFYRAVDRDSPLFYEAIYEQSWAFFMAGYPNHSLGAVYSAESPFFKDVFNPEVSMLRSINYYWLCRYEDSRNALADFAEDHAKSVDALGEFLDRKRLTAETSYQLFENLLSGVTETSLGIPKNILSSAADQEAMMLLRNQFASLIAEMDLLEQKGIFDSALGKRKAQEALQKHGQMIRVKIGEQYIVELRALKDQFDRLYEQAQFLYVELLMSEKEQLLGRELHATSKLDKISEKRAISSWGLGDQSWNGANMKGEYWWDEIGFYIFRIEPKCNDTGASQKP